jgi:hypothetical protein
MVEGKAIICGSDGVEYEPCDFLLESCKNKTLKKVNDGPCSKRKKSNTKKKKEKKEMRLKKEKSEKKEKKKNK